MKRTRIEPRLVTVIFNQPVRLSISQVPVQVVKVGGLIATINVNLKAVSSGELIAQGKHIKFLTSRDKGIPTAPLAKPRSKL